jgi:exopolysaccharide production protein ExoZ
MTMQSIQCARAIAALLVVYFHAVLQARNLNAAASSVAPEFGECGVDLFFVISGFIMWATVSRSAVSSGSFYVRRIVRIVPLYWTLTLLAAAVSVEAPWALKSTKFSLSHVIASLAFLPWPNPASLGEGGEAMTPVIAPGWTLNYEMMFYLLFGILFTLPIAQRLKSVFVIFGAFALMVWFLSSTSKIIAFYDPLLVFEFVLGVLVAHLWERSFVASATLASTALFFAFATLLSCDIWRPDISRFYHSGLPAAICIYGLISLEASRFWLRLRWLGRFGDASYSLYLTHVFVLAGMRNLWTSILPERNGIMWQIAFVFLSLAMSMFVGQRSYEWLERPLNRAIRRLMEHRGFSMARA